MNAGSVSACQSCSGSGANVRGVDELGPVHVGVLQCSFQVCQRGDPVAVIVLNPPFGDLIDRCGIEVVQLLPAPPDGRHQMGSLQDGQVLAHRLTGHVETDAQLAQVLAVAGVQAIEEHAPARVGQGPEHLTRHLASNLKKRRPGDGPYRATGHRSAPTADFQVVRVRHTHAALEPRLSPTSSSPNWYCSGA